MSARTRLAKLEAALSPKEATLAWLAESHQFPTLPAYVGWLVDQPAEAAPFWRVPEQAQRAVRASMRGQPRDLVEATAHQAVRDAVFLVELVIRLNVETTEMVRVEGLRHAALIWEGRALSAVAEQEIGLQSRQVITRSWAAWREAVSIWQVNLHLATETRRLLERRYLDGQDALFPDLADHWAKVMEPADALASAADQLAPSPGRQPRRDHRPRGQTQAGSLLVASAAHMTDGVRQTTRSMLGAPTAAVAAMERPRVEPAS